MGLKAQIGFCREAKWQLCAWLREEKKASILLRWKRMCYAEECASREGNLCVTKTSVKIKETS